jgi:hypothetical protein
VLLELVGNWWRKGELPFPSMGTLAARCGVSDRQIQRAINRLVHLNLVRRVSRRTKGIIASNAYDLTPLADFLGEVAKAFPNEFRRNLARTRVQALSSRLGKATDPLLLDAPAPAAQEPEAVFRLSGTAALNAVRGGRPGEPSPPTREPGKRLTRVKSLKLG